MSNPTTEPILSGREVLKGVVENIITKCESKQISFVGQPVYVEVADDSDWHHKKKGHMVYITAYLIKMIGGNCWLIANSQGKNGYPTDVYISDLMIIPVSNSVDTENTDSLSNWAREIMMGHSYFQQSPLIVFSSQRIAVQKGKLFSQEILAYLGQNNFLAQTAEVKKEQVTSSLNPFPEDWGKYKPEVVKKLAETFLRYLNN